MGNTMANVLKFTLFIIFLITAACEKEIVNEREGHYVGELFGGGIIFWLSPDGQHGLITSLYDLDDGNGSAWSNILGEIGNSAQSMTNGANNTSAIISQNGHFSSAAKLCDEYVSGEYDDWYLPSQRELCLLVSQDFLVDYILDNDGKESTTGFTQENTDPTIGCYWSSTEAHDNIVYYYTFLGARIQATEKQYTFKVRAIRSF